MELKFKLLANTLQKKNSLPFYNIEVKSLLSYPDIQVIDTSLHQTACRSHYFSGSGYWWHWSTYVYCFL